MSFIGRFVLSCHRDPRVNRAFSGYSAQEIRCNAVFETMKTKRLLPLGIKNPIKTELPALVALEAIGKPWFSETHLSDLLAIALVSQILAVKGSYIDIVA